MPSTKTRPSSAEPAALSERVAALEREVAALKGQREGKPYMKTFGMMPDDVISREAARLGAAYLKRQPKR